MVSVRMLQHYSVIILQQHLLQFGVEEHEFLRKKSIVILDFI